MFFDINGFSRHASAPTTETRASSIEARAPVDPLAADERSTVIVSLQDRRSSLGAERRLSRILRFLFGIERPNRMADPRLEALRRFSVMSRLKGDLIANAEIQAFLEAGFAPHQMDAVRRMIVNLQAETRRAR